MENGSIDLPNLAKLVEGCPSLTYRFAAHYIYKSNEDNGFQGARLILGAPPASWSRYTYDTVRFFAGTESGSVISEWLSQGQVTLDDQQYQLSLQTSARFERRPSHTSYGLFTIRKPYTFYYMSSTNPFSAVERVLAAEGAPFFLTLQEAERTLLYDRDSTDPLTVNDQLPERGVALYLEQDEAWLESIHFSSSSLTITLDGTKLSGVRLTVEGTGIQSYDDSPAEKTISLSAPAGPPDIVKIALLKGNTWLDYFYDDRRSRSNPFVPRHTNVVFDYQEPGEEIARLIESGEGRTVEFKGEESNDRDKWKKTIVAFANTDGGYLLFGVSNDGCVVGLDRELARHGSIEHFKDGLTDAISNTITPVPRYEFLPPAQIEGRKVLAIKVISDEHTHSLLIEKAPVFFIRRDATTRAANNFEVQELVRLKDQRKGPPPMVQRGIL